MSSLKKNVIYNFVYQFLILFLPFFTAPYLSRVIGPSGIGLYSFSYSVALYFTFFTMLGLNNYGNREIAAIQDDFEKRSRTFWEIYTLQVVFFCFSFVVYMFYVTSIASDKMVALIQGIFVLSSLLDINWFFFGMEKFKLTVLRNTLVKIATVILIFIFVRTKDDIYIYVGIMACGYLISQLCLWPFLRKYICFTKVSLKDIVKHLRPNLILFVPVISVSIYKIMDKIMLGYMASMSDVGYFDNAEKIINVPIALITAIGTVMMPRMTALNAQNKIDESKRYIDKTMLIVLAFATGAMFGIISVSKEFSVLYYGKNFQQTGVIMDYLAITVLFLACGNVIRSQYLIPRKKDKIFITSAILGAIFNFTLNLILIPRYGAVGAAIGTIVAEFTVCFYQLYSVRKYFSYTTYFKHEIYFLFSGLLMYLSVKNVNTGLNDLLNLIIQMIVGAIVYSIIAGWYMIKIQKLSLTNILKVSNK
ncbi:flippase [Bacillus sp. AFS088145]|uniref:flippase n=1 Tax=Bacillus sp. AFS088145 TaxID=2033514 RepID=UPI000BF9079E|nr:flippase [Bacillus sp. AFS088145]PFH87076.1 flippase [Bacillus sp. AFS088145]